MGEIYNVITASLSYDCVAVSADFSCSITEEWPPGDFSHDTSGFTARHALLSSRRTDVTQCPAVTQPCNWSPAVLKPAEADFYFLSCCCFVCLKVSFSSSVRKCLVLWKIRFSMRDSKLAELFLFLFLCNQLSESVKIHREKSSVIIFLFCLRAVTTAGVCLTGCNQIDNWSSAFFSYFETLLQQSNFVCVCMCVFTMVYKVFIHVCLCRGVYLYM